MPFPWRPTFRGVLVVLLAVVLFVGFSSLGTWQLQRRIWKLDLIAQVEAQLAKPPLAVAGRSQWGRIGPEAAYLPVMLQGDYLHASETLVQAMTALGSGFWVITPLQMADGTVVLVNRGFVDPAHRTPASRAAGQPVGPVTVSGLLRLSEPGGRFLRPNEPLEDRWFSRDVAAIAEARNLPAGKLVPYFIDADTAPLPGGWPVAGLTVVKFRNTHLVYAGTWYALALLSVVAAWLLLRERDPDHSQLTHNPATLQPAGQRPLKPELPE